MVVEALPAPANRLGECPIWCDRTCRLWWVDVLEPALWSYDPATDRCQRHSICARRLGSIALRREGGLILACDDGLHVYDPDTGRQTFLVDPEPNRPTQRKNDGRADSLGNFWVGTLDEESYRPVGALYRIAPDLSITVCADRLRIPNALAFDAVGGRMYFADTREYAIWVCTYDPTTGETGKPSIFARTNAPARPDGSCIDAEGYLWNAEYAGRRLVRFAPSGEVSLSLDLPVTYPTCCCFGGENLDRLYITSAWEPLSLQERKDEHLAGRVLVVDVGIRGRPEFRVGF